MKMLRNTNTVLMFVIMGIVPFCRIVFYCFVFVVLFSCLKF